MSQPVAFFDVDHTLIEIQSMLSFLEYYYRVSAREECYQLALTHLQALKEAGASREALNLAFYSVLEGESWSDIHLVGQCWFAQCRISDHLMPETHGCLQQHRQDGALIVLVSGSFTPCLDPLASVLQPDAVLCTQLACRAGRLTGKVEQQVIGLGKVTAITEWMAGKGIDLQQCHAYGDDISDAPMLGLVGYPVVVGHNSELGELARLKGWRSLHNTRG